MGLVYRKNVVCQALEYPILDYTMYEFSAFSKKCYSFRPLFIHFHPERGSQANTFFRFLPHAPSEYRHEQMGGHALPAPAERPFSCSG